MSRLIEPSVVIRPQRGIELLNLLEIWEYRELLGFLAWRDLKVRYKQTAVGIAWAVLQPLAMMTVFTVFFGRLARLPSDGLPYPLFALSGLLAWNLFARVLTSSAGSLVKDQRLISKVYFPRLIIPLSSSLAALVDFAISLLLLLLLMTLFNFPPEPRLLLLPLIVFVLLIAALGTGFWLSAINVQYRDVQHTLPFLTQLWFFLTPVVYPASLVPETFRIVYALNPVVGVVEAIRWLLLGSAAPPAVSLAVSGLASITLFASGLLYFRSRERIFADSLG